TSEATAVSATAESSASASLSSATSTDDTIVPIGFASSTEASSPPLTSVVPTTAASPAPTAASTSLAFEPSTSIAPTSIVPIGTNTYTTMPIETSILYQPSETATTSTASQASGIPSSMPRVIQPPGGMPSAPDNTTLIQVGFTYGLNYPFVVSTAGSANQIFEYLPSGLAFGLNIDAAKVKMYALQPYDTTESLHYITTLALVYVPSDAVNQLQLDLHTSVATLYNNPDASTKTLMGMINPAIPMIPGANGMSNSQGSVKNPSGSDTTSDSNGAPLGGDSSSSSPVNGTSVGIGVGAVAGAAVYAAAMVYVARRYKKKRSSHARSSSVPYTDERGEMSQRNSAANYFMSGGRGRVTPTSGRGSRQSGSSANGRSVREQGISAPVLAGNSLGWN
ncbi:hypothetical protein KCU98_g21563, partial [Aureobasidium melanogenum]